MSDPTCEHCGSSTGECAEHGHDHVHRDIDTSGRREPFEHKVVLAVLIVFGIQQVVRSLLTSDLSTVKRVLGVCIALIVWAGALWIYRRGPSRSGTGTAHLAE